MFSEDLRLPDNAVMLHIGPHKTGTTAIQGAMRKARKKMAEHGVVYAGNTRQHQMAALAITGGKGLSGDRPAERKDWDVLVDEVRATTDKTVVVSSEFFDGCDDEMARMVVSELGGERVHVVVTLRPLAKILPSAWQQYVRNRLRDPYDEWLEAILNNAPFEKPTPTFWQRHHHDVQVERWASIVGPDRLLVIVVDESDPDSLMRTFEHLTGLPDGLLEPETGWTNRSLTAAETELVRLLNVEFHKRKWPAELYHHVVRRGVVRKMQTRAPSRDEPRISTPAWAIEKANEIAAAASKRIEASGVRLLGDLAVLSQVTPRPDDVAIDRVPLTLDGAAHAVVGAIDAAALHWQESPVQPAKRRLPWRARSGTM
ncbi:MAG TPA: hypothetical protein VHE57_11320 [Mycobacteriales bacterium]|nr:hypothetical protein [Mycobacteriales bacterium]